MSKDVRPQNSAKISSGPHEIKTLKQRPRSDQVTYSHKSAMKRQFSNQTPTSCFGKLSSNKNKNKKSDESKNNCSQTSTPFKLGELQEE